MMKKMAVLLVVSMLGFSAQSHADGWFDSLKSMIGIGDSSAEESAVAPSLTGMIGDLSENLGVNDKQAKGGLASILNYAKKNISSEQFSSLSNEIPGIDGILNSVPALSASKGGLGGLMDQAAEYNDSLKSINELKNQFEALGLKPEMIMGYVKQAMSYLDTEQGQEAKKILSQAFSKLTA